MNESEVTGVPSWNVQSLSLMVHVFESSDSMDSATPSACSVVSGSYVIRPVQRASMTSPPLVSDVLVGTSGFSGSPMYSENEPPLAPSSPLSPSSPPHAVAASARATRVAPRRILFLWTCTGCFLLLPTRGSADLSGLSPGWNGGV